MFKLPSPPSKKADSHELADFMELLAWSRGSVSARNIVACLGREDDNAYNIGCNDDEDESTAFMDDVLHEIERRWEACRAGYPFTLCRAGTVVQYCSGLEGDIRSLVYRYLLLSTRLNMNTDKVQDGIDGSELLEWLAAHALKNYLGPETAKSLVFGTAGRRQFRKGIEDLCQHLCEGIGFRNIDGDVQVSAKDDKLDAVAWVPFSDRLPGKLVVFGQCKTGTNWEDRTAELQPQSFINRWLREPLVVTPIRAFCVSEAADRVRWKSLCLGAGMLMDRCRLVEFSDNLPDELVADMQKWVEAAHSVASTAV